MKKNLVIILLFLMGSCIHSDVPECPEVMNIRLYVKDKKYFNQQDAVENQSFSHYVKDLYYGLYHAGERRSVIKTEYNTINNNNQEEWLQFNSLPSRSYIVGVWGNLVARNNIETTETDLHPNHQESTDIYLATDTFTITSGEQSSSIGLERTKGLLQVLCKNFPGTIRRLDIQVSDLYQYVESNFKYSGETGVSKSFSLTEDQPLVLETFLAPTVQGKTSKLQVALYKEDSNLPLFTSAEINLAMRRNEITIFEINYNTPGNALEIWVQIDGEWEMVYHLQLSSLEN